MRSYFTRHLQTMVGTLGRLWQQQGKRHEAHQMLSEIYTWFTEGFDTVDLKEAKTVLEELSHWNIESSGH